MTALIHQPRKLKRAMSECKRSFADCHCYREERHRIHKCECGGSWTYDAEGREMPRTFPGGLILGEALDMVLIPWRLP